MAGVVLMLMLLLLLMLMVGVVLQRDQHWLAIGQYDGVTRLLQRGHSGVGIARRGSCVHTPPPRFPMGLPASLGALGQVQGGEGHLFADSTSTLERRGEATHHLLNLRE